MHGAILAPPEKLAATAASQREPLVAVGIEMKQLEEFSFRKSGAGAWIALRDIHALAAFVLRLRYDFHFGAPTAIEIHGHRVGIHLKKDHRVVDAAFAIPPVEGNRVLSNISLGAISGE
jgi:hypothetical protein